MNDVSIILRAPVSRPTASATLPPSSSLQAAVSAMTSGTGYRSINAKLLWILSRNQEAPHQLAPQWENQ